MSVRAQLAATALWLLASAASAQELRTTHVADGIYMITGAGGNVTVSVGSSGVMVVDSGSAAASDALLAAIRAVSDAPIRYVLNTGVRPEYIGGNVALRHAGATFTGGNATVVAGVDVGAAIVAHENALKRMAGDDVAIDAQPTETFYVPKLDLYFNGEPVELFHQPATVDDTGLFVHFRRSDVIATGDFFRVDRYPFIDVEHGGSIDGIIDALNALVDLAVSDTLAEGGTLLVPGRGRVCDEGDLVRYRDMVTMIRDRVRTLLERGQTLQQIKAAKPTLDFESRYGRDPGWNGDDFIEAVYRSLSAT
jgi:glyoxylase-like metal-dependent hydrolase (beta-lactamase superfamily II)